MAWSSEKQSVYYKKWATRNRARLKSYQQLYYKKRQRELRKRAARWYSDNRSRARATRTLYQQKRHKEDPGFRVVRNLRNRVWCAVVRDTGAKKSSRTRELLGCSIQELRAHLEAKFCTGMTWENYGPVWHIDHVKPCARFNLLDPAQQRECFHYTNLQPLFAEENLEKGCR